MLIVPAIDLLAGKCVRLTRGDYDSSRVYSEDPVEMALRLEAAGALWIHVVDLDAARGSGSNRVALAAIRAAVRCRIECGGGVRTPEDARRLGDGGMDRLVVGTVLVKSPRTVEEMARLVPGRITAGIDADEGRVKVAGWVEGSATVDLDLADTARLMGLTGVVYTSIRRDGTLAGPDVQRTNGVAAVGLPVLLSGGVGSEEHIADLEARRGPRVVGVIVGKALYEGRVDLRAVIRRHQVPADGSAW